MVVKIQKWGNSLALRLPMSFAKEISLHEGGEVDLSIHDGKLVIEPLKPAEYKLREMLSCVREDNLHGEYSFGESTGKES